MNLRRVTTARGSVWLVLVAVSLLCAWTAPVNAEEYSDAFPSAEVRLPGYAESVYLTSTRPSWSLASIRTWKGPPFRW